MELDNTLLAVYKAFEELDRYHQEILDAITTFRNSPVTSELKNAEQSANYSRVAATVLGKKIHDLIMILESDNTACTAPESEVRS